MRALIILFVGLFATISFGQELVKISGSVTSTSIYYGGAAIQHDQTPYPLNNKSFFLIHVDSLGRYINSYEVVSDSNAQIHIKLPKGIYQISETVIPEIKNNDERINFPPTNLVTITWTSNLKGEIIIDENHTNFIFHRQHTTTCYKCP
jgi:hypothetical protein